MLASGTGSHGGERARVVRLYSGFYPRACGWGETLPLRAIFPKARIVVYCEFFYRAEGQDVHFDPEGPRLGVDGLAALQCKNASSLLALTEADVGMSPTRWQRSTFPQGVSRQDSGGARGSRSRERSRPDKTARFTLPGGKVVTKSDEVVTFASRNLEPVRGYHVFLRALPEILRARPEAQVVIAGGDGNSYSHAPPAGKTWKTHYLDEVVSNLDLSRVHFVGSLDRGSYLNLLQVSSAHVYLTYPFVLSWSLLDAMATECEIVASDTAPVREVIEDRQKRRSGSISRHARRWCKPSSMRSQTAHQHRSSVQRREQTVSERFDKEVCVQEALRAMGVDGQSATETAVAA